MAELELTWERVASVWWLAARKAMMQKMASAA
jgi:hypothetical protein